MSELEQQALTYISRGWPVLWLKPRSKAPATPHGVRDATVDPDVIREWAASMPSGNIGIATGAPGPDVVDVDDPKAAREFGLELEPTGAPMAATSRGVHAYFRGTDGPSLSFPWGEVKRGGVYVVAPSSIHESGKVYTWLLSPNGSLPTMPDGLVPDRSGAGAGEAPGSDPVLPGAMYEHLKDRAVRCVRTGMLEVEAVTRALTSEFEAVRVPGAHYNGAPRDTERIAEWAIGSEIAERERAADASRFGRYRESRRRPAEEEVSDRCTLRILDVARMLSTPPPPVPWAVEPMLARGCTTMLAGREGRGKSLLALALAAGSGRGENVAGMVTNGSLRTLYVDAENGPQEAHRRIYGLCVEAGKLTYVEADGFSLRHGIDELLELVEDRAPDLLILDSLRSLEPGLDENDSLQVEAALRPVVRTTQAREMATLLLHHAAGASGEYRGSTAIGAAVELGFTLSRIEDDPEGESRRKLTCWKSRPAAEPPPRWLAIEPVPGGGIRISETEPYEPEHARPRDERREDVLGVLGEEPMSERKIADTAGLARTTTQRILRDLEDEGLTERTGNGWVAHRPGGPRHVGHVGHSPNREELRRRFTAGWGR